MKSRTSSIKSGVFILANLLISAIASNALSSAPNDPLFYSQWALHNDGSQSVIIDFDNLHAIQQKAIAGVDIGWLASQARLAQLAVNPVLVAVIDSGIDVNHPDLEGRIQP